MNEERPKLDLDINLKDFSDFYWLKSELRNYCRLAGLSSIGSKFELIKKITDHLAGAITTKTKRLSEITTFVALDLDHENLTLNTKVNRNFKCTRKIRDFFEKVAGKQFHFSVELQNFIKTNPDLSFQEVLDEWRRQRNKSRQQKKIEPQFEYNQYFRDFFADPDNHGKSKKDCIESWKEIRSGRGSRKYKPQNNSKF